MKAIHSMIAALALAFVLPAPADAGINDPEIIIYRFPGVRDDNGAANVGVATVFHCTNFSGAEENIRLVTRDLDSILRSNKVFPILHLVTKTFSTHVTNAYGTNQSNLTTGTVGQGTTAIAATSINIICTAETIDASTNAPVGVARRGIRFSPVPGSQE
jgi:hypothetical protein